MDEAIQALLNSGFALEGSDYVKRSPAGAPRTKYSPVEGGFERFEWRPGAMEGETSDWQQYPHSIDPEWASVSGLIFHAAQGAGKVLPTAFITTYPPEEIVKVYGPQPEPQE